MYWIRDWSRRKYPNSNHIDEIYQVIKVLGGLYDKVCDLTCRFTLLYERI